MSPVRLSLEDVLELQEELQEELEERTRRMEMDSRVLSQMWTQFGRRQRNLSGRALPVVVQRLSQAIKRS